MKNESLFQKHRKKQGYLQKDIAQIVNMPHNTYSQKERGIQEFTLSEAYVISSFLEITTNEMYEMLSKWSGKDE